MKQRPLKTYDDYVEFWHTLVDRVFNSAGKPGTLPGLRAYPRFRFIDAAQLGIRNHLEDAWILGAKECGFDLQHYPRESTAEQDAELEQVLHTQTDYTWVSNFHDAIEQAALDGKDRDSLDYRVNMWANRWNEVYNRARSIFCADKKAKWILGETHKHCRTCFGFNGRVYRYSTWRENDALPQTHALECEGYNCLCTLEDTDERITPGRFPRSLLKR